MHLTAYVRSSAAGRERRVDGALAPAVVLVTAVSTRRMSAVDDRLARSGAVVALFLIGVVGVARAVA